MSATFLIQFLRKQEVKIDWDKINIDWDIMLGYINDNKSSFTSDVANADNGKEWEGIDPQDLFEGVVTN